MALSLPITRSIEITAAQSYVLSLSICNTNSTVALTATALPLCSSTLRGRGYLTSAETETTRITLVPGMRLMQIVSTRDGFPVFENVPESSLSCVKSASVVSVTFPMGLTYVAPTGPSGEFGAGASPSRYRYTVTAPPSTLIAGGLVTINMRPPPPPLPDFSVCSVKVQ
jgi:hypothetical protein